MATILFYIKKNYNMFYRKYCVFVRMCVWMYVNYALLFRPCIFLHFVLCKFDFRLKVKFPFEAARESHKRISRAVVITKRKMLQL